MKYRLINTEKKPSRMAEVISVSNKRLLFNVLMCAKMGIERNSKLAFLVDENGFVAINVLDKDSPSGRVLGRAPRSKSLTFVSTELTKHIVPGRYRITGRDGAFWLTDIKWEEGL